MTDMILYSSHFSSKLASQGVQLVALVAFGIAAYGTLDAQESRELRAGAAKRDITPKEPVPMWGYGARHADLSTGTMDPLMATALVIESKGTKVAIVGTDLGRAPIEDSLQRIRAAIRDRAGIQVSFIAGSHTHHGPVLELSDRPGRGKGRFDSAIRYGQFLEEQLIDVILEADRVLEPVRMEAGSTELENFNRNRHSKRDPVPVDRSLTVLRLLATNENKTIATLFNFAAHPTSIPTEKYEFSADFVGAARDTIERELGGIAVFMQGAAGDLSTNRGPHGDYMAYGKALGNRVASLAHSLEPVPIKSPSIQFYEEQFQFSSRTNFRNPLVQGAYSVAFFPELVTNFIDEYADGIRPRLTVVTIHRDVAFVGVSGEFFCQHAIRLRERARVPHLFFFGYNNGYHQYFPTIEAADEGGYGADTLVAPAELGAGELIMDRALIKLYELRSKVATRKQP